MCCINACFCKYHLNLNFASKCQPPIHQSVSFASIWLYRNDVSHSNLWENIVFYAFLAGTDYNYQIDGNSYSYEIH